MKMFKAISGTVVDTTVLASSVIKSAAVYSAGLRMDAIISVAEDLGIDIPEHDTVEKRIEWAKKLEQQLLDW